MTASFTKRPFTEICIDQSFLGSIGGSNASSNDMDNASVLTIESYPNKKRKSRAVDPVDYILATFEDNGYDIDVLTKACKQRLQQPTPDMIASYTTEAIKAVREGDMVTLKDMHARHPGSLNACNRFGNTLLHLACRRGLADVVTFLVETARVCVDMVDDVGRTPLHDACWTPRPNFEIVDTLLRAAPEHAILPDHRGDSPFDYVRSVHWNAWLAYLISKRSLLTSKLIEPHSHPIVMKRCPEEDYATDSEDDDLEDYLSTSDEDDDGTSLSSSTAPGYTL